MSDLVTYRVRLKGQLDVQQINLHSPIQLSMDGTPTLTDQNGASTQLLVNTDQSGLVGLLRYLHGKGLVFLSIDSCDEAG